VRTDAMSFYRIEKDFRQAGFYETPQHKCLFNEIRAAIKKGELIAISGMIGSGKTVMLSKLRDTLTREGKTVVSRSLMVEKQKVQLRTLIAAIFYDLHPNTDKEKVSIPTQGELRERVLKDLIRQERKPVVLFIDEAHDLTMQTLKGLKRLIEVTNDSNTTLSVILAGHPKLRNDLDRANMEEIGYRTSFFSIDEAIDSRREYIEWLLKQCSEEDVEPTQILQQEAIDLLAERLVTPLQIEQHLKRALEAGHDADERPVSTAMVSSVLSGSLMDIEAKITRLGYDHKSLAALLKSPTGEVKQFIQGQLDSDRARELHQQLLVVGLPV